MPWPYLEWNILSSLCVDLLSIKQSRQRSKHGGSSHHRGYYSSFMVHCISDKTGSALGSAFVHVGSGHLFKQLEQ